MDELRRYTDSFRRSNESSEVWKMIEGKVPIRTIPPIGAGEAEAVQQQP